MINGTDLERTIVTANGISTYKPRTVHKASRRTRRKVTKRPSQRMNHTTKYKRYREEENQKTDRFVIKVGICVIICIGCFIISKSNSLGAVRFNEHLNLLLNKNVTIGDLESTVKSVFNLKNDTVSINPDIKIDEDILEEMNQDDLYYENQKK